jgi:radical SAM-linked protein
MIVRMRFGKLGKVRWTSHRDVARMWERALRRAKLPVAYTGGFSPRPQLSFGLALPTGCESVAEYLDVGLETEVEPALVAQRVGPLLPRGIGVVGAGQPEPGSASLQEEVTSCTWDISVMHTTQSELDGALSKVMGAASLPVLRERKGHVVSDDLRPSLFTLFAQHTDGEHGTRLVAEVGTRPRGVRPAELAELLGIELGLARRTCQWIERGGSKFEPLDVQPVVCAVAVERAS